MKIIRKIMATATAAACVVAFNTVAVSSAFAADNGEATVAITIINNDDPNNPEIFRNCYVTVSEGATVGDALYEAGFDKVDTLEETAENPSTTYTTSHDYPYFNGQDYNEKTGEYWIDLYNGEVDMDGNTAVTSKVSNGAHYQYIYDAPSIDPVTQSMEYNFNYSKDDEFPYISDPLSADVVNSYCMYASTKITKKNVEDKAIMMTEAEKVYSALSESEKAKVKYPLIEIRDEIIRVQDSVAIDNVAKTKTVKAKANKKVTVKLKKITSTSGNKVMYFQKTKNAKVTVNTNGKITVKKGLKKNVNIKVAAYCGTEAAKTITIKVKAA